MTRYLIIKEETCTVCDGDGVVHGAEYGGTDQCPKCEGSGIQLAEWIDADEWLAAALVRLGMVTDGK